MDKPAITRTPESGAPSYSIWQLLGLLAGPLLFLFIHFLVRPDSLSPTATAVLAGTAWVATWWLTRAAPLPVTGLLPLVLFPVLGIASSSEAAAPYVHPTVLLLLAGSLGALAAVRWNLHRRIALGILALPGASPARLVLGFLTATAILSIWLSTAVTTVIMLPLGLAVITQKRRTPHGQKIIAMKAAPPSNFATAVILSIAYGAAFSGPSLLERLLLIVCGGAILLLACAPDWKAIPGETAPGPVSGQEWWVLAVCAVTASMWIARPYLISPYLPLVDDAAIAMVGALLLFLIPTDLAQNRWLLSAEALQQVPWSILLLIGAGFTIAGAFERTGLLQWLTPTWAVAGRSALELVVTTALAASFVSTVSVKQLVKAGLWLGLAGTAVTVLFG